MVARGAVWSSCEARPGGCARRGLVQRRWHGAAARGRATAAMVAAGMARAAMARWRAAAAAAAVVAIVALSS